MIPCCFPFDEITAADLCRTRNLWHAAHLILLISYLICGYCGWSRKSIVIKKWCPKFWAIKGKIILLPMSQKNHRSSPIGIGYTYRYYT